VIRRSIVAAASLAAVVVGGCSSPPPTTTVTTDTACDSATTVAIDLPVGGSRIVDAIHDGHCILLPGSASAQEYVVVAYAGQGDATTDGVSDRYALQGNPAGASSVVLARQGRAFRAPYGGIAAARFDSRRRADARTLAQSPSLHPSALLHRSVTPVPVVGAKDSFFVCATLDCNGFNRIGATVVYAGQSGIIYVDDHQLTGADSLTNADIVQLGTVFDQYLYPTDTVSFGRESDINGDGRVDILITPAVNGLTPDCSDGRVIGYFLANDLVPGNLGSNAREMFYAFTTAPATLDCTAVDRSRALTELPPTLIHEFQHMISFNQHVLLRGGSDQVEWLNEGLSHFAEELGARVVPDAACPAAPDCFAEFANDNLLNAFSYLSNPEATFLAVPADTSPGLPERGAAWLMIRWLADHYSADTLLGTALTRNLEMSTTVGADRIAQTTGVDFATLVGNWQLANWLDNLPGFPQTGLLNYRSWNFRDVFAAGYPSVFDAPYPLVPDIATGTYARTGTLRAGSGVTVRFQLPAGSPAVPVRLAASLGGATIDGLLLPRFAVVRTQ
jgi:hypothetical protein